MGETLAILLVGAGLFAVAGQTVLRRLNVHLAFVFVTFVVLPALCLSVSDRYVAIENEFAAVPLFMAAYLAGLAIPFSLVAFGSRFDFAEIERGESIGPAAILLAFLVLLLNVAIRHHYGVFLSGAANENVVKAMPYAAVSLLQILGTLSLACCVSMIVFCRSRAILIAYLAVFAAAALASGGRRDLLLVILMAALLRHRTTCFRPSLRLLALGCACLALFIAITPLFSRTRAHFLEITHHSRQPAVVALPMALQKAAGSIGEGSQPYLDLVAAQVSNRGNAGTFLLRIADSDREALGGAMLSASILWALPGAFVDKPLHAPEQMIQQAFSMPLTDDANSVPAILYSDFSTGGIVLAGVVVGGLLSFYLRQAHRACSPFLRCLGLSLFFELSIAVEVDLHAILVEARNAALIAGAVILARALHHGLEHRVAELRGTA